MKKEIMKKKLNDLQCEIRKIQDCVDDYTREYLIKLEKIIEEYKNKLLEDEVERKLLKAEEQIESGKTVKATEVFKELEEIYGF